MADDFESSGGCVVCQDPVDQADMGKCSECCCVFHWGQCGTWNDGQHTCNDCITDKEERAELE